MGTGEARVEAKEVIFQLFSCWSSQVTKSDIDEILRIALPKASISLFNTTNF
jgi:hypothetical protein